MQLRVWNLNICIEKIDAKSIGGDDISDDVITLGTCISMFALIGESKFQRRSCKLDLLPFPDSTTERPAELALRLGNEHLLKFTFNIEFRAL